MFIVKGIRLYIDHQHHDAGLKCPCIVSFRAMVGDWPACHVEFVPVDTYVRTRTEIRKQTVDHLDGKRTALHDCLKERALVSEIMMPVLNGNSL